MLFASEIKALFSTTMIERLIDPQAMDQLCTFWTTLPGRTMFKGVHELPLGHFLKIANGCVTVKKYWDIPFYTPEKYIDWREETICEKIMESHEKGCWVTI